MQLITILIIQISLMLVGILTAISLGAKKKLEIIGFSYLLGSGVMTMLFLLLHWFFNFKLNQVNFLISFSSSIATLLLIIMISKRIKIVKSLFSFKLNTWLKSFSTIEKSIFSIIILSITYSFFKNYFWPVTDWDALAFYDFRAKVIMMNGTMNEGIELKYFFQYPPYTSFLHVFGYLFGAERVRIAYTFIFSSLLMSFFNLVRRRQNRLTSLFFTLILSSIPMIFEHSVIAYANLAFTTFFSIGLILLWFYFEKKITSDLLIGVMLIGLSTWIRSTEPFWILGIILIILSAIKHRSNYLTSALLLPMLNLPNRLWRSFLAQLNFLSQTEIIDITPHATAAVRDFLLQEQSALDLIVRTFEVFKYLIVTLVPDFIFLLILLILATFDNYKKKQVEIFSLLVLLGIIFAGTLVFSFTFETWDVIGGSIARMSMIFIPLILYIIAKDLRYE